MALLSQKQQRDLLIAAGLADFVTRGRITAAAYDVLKAAVVRSSPPAGSALKATARFAGRAATRVAPAALPVVAAVDAYEMGKRDAAASMAMGGPGYALQNIPNPFLINPTFGEAIGVEPTVDIYTPALKARKKVSKYAKNVGIAMRAIKASTKGGPKGKLSSPKKTFRTVSKTVSKIMKGGTRPRGGITGIISKAVKGTFKKTRKPKKTRSGRSVRRY
jgi:hypothetical protein